MEGYQILDDLGRGVFISHQVGDRGGNPYDLIKVAHIYRTKSKTRPTRIEYGRREITAYDMKKGGKYGRVTQHLLFPSGIITEVIEVMTLLAADISGDKPKTAKNINKELSDQEYIKRMVDEGKIKHL